MGIQTSVGRSCPICGSQILVIREITEGTELTHAEVGPDGGLIIHTEGDLAGTECWDLKIECDSGHTESNIVNYLQEENDESSRGM